MTIEDGITVEQLTDDQIYRIETIDSNYNGEIYISGLSSSNNDFTGIIQTDGTIEIDETVTERPVFYVEAFN